VKADPLAFTTNLNLAAGTVVLDLLVDMNMSIGCVQMKQSIFELFECPLDFMKLSLH
jgi:hypothetical protein